jgi:hypothetical protein
LVASRGGLDSSAPVETVHRLSDFAPPHDCRITLRCLKSSFGFTHDAGRYIGFEHFRTENTCIDRFFDRRQNDVAGGEGGERIQQIAVTTAFSLHSGKTRGATWLDKSQPPQAIVWLLGAEQHDERHKGRSDAYDILGNLGEDILPAEVDYKLLELDRRRLDTINFADDVMRDAKALVTVSRSRRSAAGTLAGVPARLVWQDHDDGHVSLSVAISTDPVPGERSGFDFPLTQERFLLLAEAVRQATEKVFKPEVLKDELFDFPGGIRNERAFSLLFEP